MRGATSVRDASLGIFGVSAWKRAKWWRHSCRSLKISRVPKWTRFHWTLPAHSKGRVADHLAAGRIVVVDACCLLNLHATGRVDGILGTIPADFAAATRAMQEAGYLWATSHTRGVADKEPISHESLVSAGLLREWDLASEDEYATFVDFSRALDDGEARTCALAVHRGGVVATDDRAALRLLAGRRPAVPAVSTSHLLFRWARMTQVSAMELELVLRAIRTRARYVPPRTDPNYVWWLQGLGVD
jgi:hypothetical protein